MRKILFCLLTIFFLQGTSYGAFNFVDNGDGTITDTRTNLVWLKNVNPWGGDKNWYDAVTYCSSLTNGQAGLTDGSIAGQWRLPNIYELESLGTDPPSTWEAGFPPSVSWTTPGIPFTGMLGSNSYWSCMSYASDTGTAWTVDMNAGNVNLNPKSSASGPVWPVRDKFTPRFTDNNNGTVTDTRTGLVWLKNANPCGSKYWNDAATYCSNLSSGTAGLTDGSVAGQWRLPTKTELQGIGTDPPATWESGYPSVPWAMPGAPFTSVISGGGAYWSGTSAYNTNFVWLVIIPNGSVGTHEKSLSDHYVWPVRNNIITTTSSSSSTTTISSSSSSSGGGGGSTAGEIIRITNDTFQDGGKCEIYVTPNGNVFWRTIEPSSQTKYFNGSEIIIPNKQPGDQIGFPVTLEVSEDGMAVWFINDGHDREIVLFDGQKTIQITNNDYDDFYPTISRTGGYIAWVGTPDASPLEGPSQYFKWEIYLYKPSPTLVTLSSLKATPSKNKVNLNWKTESEIDNAGFNVWRAEGFKKITPAIIPAQGSATDGAEYDYLDLDVFNRKPYFYLLEDIDNEGLSTFHGPVKAVPRAVYGIFNN